MSAFKSTLLFGHACDAIKKIFFKYIYACFILLQNAIFLIYKVISMFS